MLRTIQRDTFLYVARRAGTSRLPPQTDVGCNFCGKAHLLKLHCSPLAQQVVFFHPAKQLLLVNATLLSALPLLHQRLHIYLAQQVFGFPRSCVTSCSFASNFR